MAVIFGKVTAKYVRNCPAWGHKTVWSVSFEQDQKTHTEYCFVFQNAHSNSNQIEKLEVYKKVKQFYKSITAFLRGSAFEFVAILDYLIDNDQIRKEEFKNTIIIFNFINFNNII